MGLTATSRAASLWIGAPSPGDSSSGAAGPTLVYAASAATHIRLPNTTPLQDVVQRLEADPRRAELLAQARQRMAQQLAVPPLSALRMSKGLSQRALAERCGMGQAHVAKIEQGQHDPKTGTVARMAAALGCAPEEVFAAIVATHSSAPRP